MSHAQLLEIVQRPRERQLYLQLELCKSNRIFLRWELWKLDPNCYYCRRPVTRKKSTLDHVIPQAKGGKDTRENLVLCCRRCNTAKAEMTLDEWVMNLLESYLSLAAVTPRKAVTA